MVPGCRGNGIDVIVRADQIDEFARARRAGRQVGNVEGHQIHGNATHYGQPVPAERGPAPVAQRPQIAVGITDADRRQPPLPRETMRRTIANGPTPVNFDGPGGFFLASE